MISMPEVSTAQNPVGVEVVLSPLDLYMWWQVTKVVFKWMPPAPLQVIMFLSRQLAIALRPLSQWLCDREITFCDRLGGQS